MPGAQTKHEWRCAGVGNTKKHKETDDKDAQQLQRLAAYDKGDLVTSSNADKQQYEPREGSKRRCDRQDQKDNNNQLGECAHETRFQPTKRTIGWNLT